MLYPTIIECVMDSQANYSLQGAIKNTTIKMHFYINCPDISSQMYDVISYNKKLQ